MGDRSWSDRSFAGDVGPDSGVVALRTSGLLLALAAEHFLADEGVHLFFGADAGFLHPVEAGKIGIRSGKIGGRAGPGTLKIGETTAMPDHGLTMRFAKAVLVGLLGSGQFKEPAGKPVLPCGRMRVREQDALSNS